MGGKGEAIRGKVELFIIGILAGLPSANLEEEDNPA